MLFVGSIEISDYLDLIVREVDLSRFLSGLIDFLASSLADSWSAIDWYNLPDSSPTLAALKMDSENRGWKYNEEIYRSTPRIALNGSFEDYLANVDKKQRHEIRRKMRRATESGRVRFYVVDKVADIEPELESFFHLMVQDPNKALFIKDVMRDQMSNSLKAAHTYGYLWLAFLEVDGVKGAASLNFDYKNKLWGYSSGVSRVHMEFSPGDWTELARKFQQELYLKIFRDEPFDHYIAQTVQALKAGRHDAQLIYRKRLRQKLSDYTRNVPPHVQAAIKAEKIFADKGLPSRYYKRGWIEYYITLNGPESVECRQSPLDYQHYIDRQLMPVADSILSVLGRNMESIIQDQIELF